MLWINIRTQTKLRLSFTLMCKTALSNICFCTCSAGNEPKRSEPHRLIIRLRMHDGSKNRNTDTFLSVCWDKKVSVLAAKIKS